MSHFAVSNNAGLPEDFLNRVKALLLENKDKLDRALAQFADKDQQTADLDFNARFPNYGDSEDDSAREVADYAANLSLEQNLERMLRDVISALKRIEEGTYGTCRYCHKPIEEKRLLARPTSSACIHCKKTIIQEA